MEGCSAAKPRSPSLHHRDDNRRLSITYSRPMHTYPSARLHAGDRGLREKFTGSSGVARRNRLPRIAVTKVSMRGVSVVVGRCLGWKGKAERVNGEELATANFREFLFSTHLG